MNDKDLKILRALNTLKECLDRDDPRFSDKLQEAAYTLLNKTYRLLDFYKHELNVELGNIKPIKIR
jgi:hypothetical protein